MSFSNLRRLIRQTLIEWTIRSTSPDNDNDGADLRVADPRVEQLASLARASLRDVDAIVMGCVIEGDCIGHIGHIGKSPEEISWTVSSWPESIAGGISRQLNELTPGELLFILKKITSNKTALKLFGQLVFQLREEMYGPELDDEDDDEDDDENYR